MNLDAIVVIVLFGPIILFVIIGGIWAKIVERQHSRKIEKWRPYLSDRDFQEAMQLLDRIFPGCPKINSLEKMRSEQSDYDNERAWNGYP